MLSLTFYKHRRYTGFDALLYNQLFLKFALGMVSIFGLLFIYNLGRNPVESLWIIFAFLFTQRLVVSLALFPSWALLERTGYRRTMSVAILALALKLFLLSQATFGAWGLLLVAAIGGGIFIALHQLAFYGLFVEDGDGHHIGQQVGLLEVVSRLSTIAAPLLAGLLIDQIGFPFMFILALGIVALSVIPLYQMPPHSHSHRPLSLKRLSNELNHHSRPLIVEFIGSAATLIHDVFWPIYLYLLIQDFSRFGAVFSLALLLSSLVVLYAGRLYDHRPLHRFFPLAAIGSSLAWFLRFNLLNPVPVISADLSGRVFNPFWWMKIKRYQYLFGRSMSPTLFAFLLEYAYTLGFLLNLCLVTGLLLITGLNWHLLFIPAVFGTLAAAWLVRKQ